MANRLARETSLYLKQHANNPVDWYPWGDEAFETARREDKPVLLSVGYAACHWCHVMERESFEDEETAELMNRHFVNIKVDREERPDVDAIYMSALQAMTGHGGWPMTVVMTPDGKPFFAGTYFPPKDRMGHPGFTRVLEAVAEAWRERRDEVLSSGTRVTDHLDELSRRYAAPGPISRDMFPRAVESLSQSFDSRHGGFGGAPKFPPHSAMRFLLRESGRHPREMAIATLKKMAQGGIHDHLGGGFARYSVDERWLVPHFEKMLYDNAQLIQRYAEAFAATGDALFAETVHATVLWAKREMKDGTGGFYSALDADSEGEEGKYYLWDEEEIDHVLGEDALIAKAAYGVTAAGNFEGRNILVRSEDDAALADRLGMSEEKLKDKLSSVKRRLLTAREERVRPALDDKIITSWNGLMLQALADAGRITDRSDYIALATRNAAFLTKAVLADGRLKHVYSAGAAKVEGLLEDYAYFGLGLLALYRATFDSRWLTTALSLAETITRHFVDEEAGGFFSTPDDGEALLVRPKSFTDSPNPSENAAAAELLLTLGRYTGNADWQELAERTAALYARAMENQPQAFGSMLCVAQMICEPSCEIAIFGDAGDLETHALIETARSAGPRDAALAFVDDANDPVVAKLPFLQGRGRQDGQATAYVCWSGHCKMPVTKPEELAAQFQE